MLHKETVKGETFKLLESLMQDEKLSSFNLAGGTSLALLMGHRNSIDLDLFTPKPFDAKELEAHLTKKYDFQSEYLRGNTLKGTINDVKIDCIAHVYPFVKDIVEIDNIRLYSKEDVAAMKLSAIADNGTRIKDFIDVACLSTKCCLSDMLQAYEDKFRNSNSMRAIKGLNYYEDINFNDPIQMSVGSFSWDKIKERLLDMQMNPNKLYSHLPVEQVVNQETELKEAIKKNDFTRLASLKDEGYTPSLEVIKELKGTVSKNTMIAIQKIFDLPSDLPGLSSIKLVQSNNKNNDLNLNLK